MSEWTVHLELEEGTTSKFWRARVVGNAVYVNYGSVGSAGQTHVTELADPASAAIELDRLIGEMRAEGYTPSGGGGGEIDDDESDEDEGSADDEDEAPKIKVPKVAPPPPQRAATTPPSRRPPGATRYVHDVGSPKVEMHLSIEGPVVRIESIETHGSPEAAQRAFDERKRKLAGEGFRQR
ncbi:MAG: hypothetical protein JWP01_1015 [Myxococcales bacterium]|nr:hypothetical protein [Myxococcales bacterium]